MKPPQKPKNWMDKVKSAITGSSDIAELKAKQDRIRKEAAAEQSRLDTEIARKESELAAAERERDPQYRAEQERIKSIIKARHSEARRLASLNELITEHERRHPCKDESLISFYEAQIARESLWGVFSKGKE